jgi:ABC-type branched-subunit amino acid transport system ATPase component
MLSVEEITSGYVEGIDILRDVSLDVRKGCITGIIGPNGAGKSTLLRSIFGFIHPYRGRIKFEGKEITNYHPYRLKQMGISYMLQEFSTFPQLTVRDNLLLGAWVFRRDRKLVKKRLEEVYQFFPLLLDKNTEKATYLSGGNLRMLSLGKEIMTKPKLFLVDEPSAGLAPLLVKEIYGFLKKIAEQGTTVLIVDQNIMRVLEISHYINLIEMGQVKQAGPKEDFEGSIREIIREALIDK